MSQFGLKSLVEPQGQYPVMDRFEKSQSLIKVLKTIVSGRKRYLITLKQIACKYLCSNILKLVAPPIRYDHIALSLKFSEIVCYLRAKELRLV